MGCSLAALLASATSPYSELLSNDVAGLVAICPQATPPPKEKASLFKTLLRLPDAIFDIWRWWDRRGGTESASVQRFVGPDADLETKELQVRFNRQSRTPVWRRMAWGSSARLRRKQSNYRLTRQRDLGGASLACLSGSRRVRRRHPARRSRKDCRFPSQAEDRRITAS